MAHNARNFHALRALIFLSVVFQAYSGFLVNKHLKTSSVAGDFGCRSQSHIFNYRGGALGDVETGKPEKLKGVCIGNDLGTSYR